MTTFRRFGRVQSLLALALLAAGMLVLPSTTNAAGEGKIARSGLSRWQHLPKLTRSVTHYMGGPASKTAAPTGTQPSIELNVDTTSDTATISLISYTFTGGGPVKFAFGNRFTVTNEQAPFKLEAVAAVLTNRSDNSEGFQVDEPIGVDVFVDPSSSGNIANATPVFSGESTVQNTDSFSVYGLPDGGINLYQGDVYIMFADLTTDTEPTQLPIVLPENGGNSDARSFVNLAPGTAGSPGQYGLTSDTLTTGGDPLLGNFVVRGLGDPAGSTDLITGGGEATDASVPAPTNLSATGTSPVTLGWTAPELPPPPTPTPVSETEPNDSPATAQDVGVNVVVSGADKDSNPGAPGGFAGDDVEDWYSFTLPQATAVSIALTDFGSGNDFDLLLYTPAGPFDSDHAVAVSGNGAGEDELIEISSLAAGTYLIAVSAFDPGVPANQTYKLTVVAASKVARYNIYQGAFDGFEPSAATFIGAVAGNTTGLVVNETSAGSYFRVTAVVGSSQSNGSNSASGAPCEGGIGFSSIKVKRSGAGAITIKGVTGSTAGLRIMINGVGFSKAPKVKNNGTVKQKGPLANGQTVGQACPPGTTLTFLTDAGCSTGVAP